jgi:hypothetical protein
MTRFPSGFVETWGANTRRLHWFPRHGSRTSHAERDRGPRVVIFGVRTGGVVSLADRYREFAAECVRVAQQSSNPDDKAMLLEMADTWLRLAERAGKAEHDKDK